MVGSPASSAAVSGLSFAPIKGTRLQAASRLEIGPAGVFENRRFFITDAQDRMVNGKQLGALQTLTARFSASDRRLELELPSGEIVSGAVVAGAEVTVRFFSRPRSARVVEGPWSAALSEVLGQPVRLLEAAPGGSAVDRGTAAAVTLISRASLERLAEIAGEPAVDGRRFRMLVEVDGLDPHEEDGWVGRVVTLGPTRIRMHGHVGRCLVTSRDPESGMIDLPTLDLIGTYRREAQTTEPLAFGIYGEVLEGGPVSLGDPVSVEPA